MLTWRWYKVGDKIAREKAGQALRDAIKTRRAGGKKRAYTGTKACDEDQRSGSPQNNQFQQGPNDGDSSSEDGRGESSTSVGDWKRRRSADDAIRRNDGVQEKAMLFHHQSTRAENERISAVSDITRNTNVQQGTNLPVAAHQAQQSNDLPASIFSLSMDPSNISRFERKLSSELEPRPISSLRPSHPRVGPTSANHTDEAMRTRTLAHSLANDTSYTTDEDHTRRLTARQDRSEESNLKLLRYLLQEPCDVERDDEPFTHNCFFVSTPRTVHLTSLQEDSSQEILRPEGSYARASSWLALDYPTLPSHLQHRQDRFGRNLPANLAFPSRVEQHVIPTTIDSDHFMKMGRGTGGLRAFDQTDFVSNASYLPGAGLGSKGNTFHKASPGSKSTHTTSNDREDLSSVDHHPHSWQA